MSTYLQLCVDARQECVAGGSGPTAVSGNVGTLKSIVDWVSQAYTEIQEKHFDWQFLRSTFTFNTVSGADTYAYGACTDSRLTGLITRFATWLPEQDGYQNTTSYLTSGGVGGEVYLVYLPWNIFKNIYKKGTQNNAQPVHISIDPHNNLVLGPKPNDIYTVQGEYQMSPQTLSADADVPEMPARFHRLIVNKSMEKYGAANAAAEVYQRGGLEGQRMMLALELDQLPAMKYGAPLS